MQYMNVLFNTWLIFTILTFTSSNVPVSRFADKTENPVKIGLLIPDNKSVAARQGAEMAVRIANQQGGYHGRPFQLVVRSMEGPWGTGSKQAVSLIFEEEVRAIMGSHDGRNAHLVEQVTTKSRIVFLSAWASDPTLSQAFIPWYFSCVPNDLQQATALQKEIYENQNLEPVALVCDNDYDSQMALKAFLRQAKQAGKPEPVQFLYEHSEMNLKALPDQIRKTGAKSIVICCRPSFSSILIRQIRQSIPGLPAFGPLLLLNENELSDPELMNYENAIMFPAGAWKDSKRLSFQQEFRKSYGKMPGAVASYAFDGMNVLIEAIRNTGLDHEDIQKSMVKTYYEGVTGTIQFDNNGNRKGDFLLMHIKKGLPVGPGSD
jgi:branched-chain amino acid transport system substrate-binding protein